MKHRGFPLLRSVVLLLGLALAVGVMVPFTGISSTHQPPAVCAEGETDCVLLDPEHPEVMLLTEAQLAQLGGGPIYTDRLFSQEEIEGMGGVDLVVPPPCLGISSNCEYKSIRYDEFRDGCCRFDTYFAYARYCEWQYTLKRCKGDGADPPWDWKVVSKDKNCNCRGHC